MENQGYEFLMSQGVLAALPASGNGHEAVTTIYAIRLGDAQVITAPGELFPEAFYGDAKYRRTDCPAADTKRPPEAAVRDFMQGKYICVFDLTRDELGYIVPGYDFHAPAFDSQRPSMHVPQLACPLTTTKQILPAHSLLLRGPAPP